MSSPALDHDSVLNTVRRWPRDAQLAFAHEILQETNTSPSDSDSQESRMIHGGLHNLVGLLATDQPAPSDEEVERWREEWRIEKYGR